MLNSYRKGACAAVAALTFVAGAVQAEEHEVSIVDGDFFPSVIFANVGDDILIYNESTASHTVVGPEGTWTSGVIAVEATFRLELEDDTPLTFTSEDGEAAAEIVLGN